MARKPADWSLVNDWITVLEAQGKASDTIRLYAYGVFRLFTGEKIPETTAATEKHVARFLAGIDGHSHAKTQYARGFRSFFSYCVRRGVMAESPAAHVEPKRPRKSPKVVLEEEELFRFLMAAYDVDPRRAWSLMLMYGVGSRRMELAGITPSDVQGDEVLLRHCKGGKQRRVELGPIASFALEQLRPWYNGTVLGGISKGSITRWAYEAAKASGLYPKVRRRPSHVLRASFATHLLRRGTPVEVVRDLMGHENLATTNEYAVVIAPERRMAVKGLSPAFEPGA